MPHLNNRLIQRLPDLVILLSSDVRVGLLVIFAIEVPRRRMVSVEHLDTSRNGVTSLSNSRLGEIRQISSTLVRWCL